MGVLIVIEEVSPGQWHIEHEIGGMNARKEVAEIPGDIHAVLEKAAEIHARLVPPPPPAAVIAVPKPEPPAAENNPFGRSEGPQPYPDPEIETEAERTSRRSRDSAITTFPEDQPRVNQPLPAAPVTPAGSAGQPLFG